MDLAELEKRVTLQEDIQEIENLQKIYGYYFDNGMFEEVMALFSKNLESVEITDHGVFKGYDSVTQMYSGMVSMKRPGWMFFEVMQSQGVVDVSPDGKTATGRWYTPSFECRPVGGAKRQTWQFGVYDNKYIKENGKWYFLKLHWNIIYWTTFERGFLKVPKISDTPFPNPDAPPTNYHPYPYQRGNVPYPFKHPITGE